ncbi:hypothetical protein [Achromobacter deleyi]|uniref:hypothetical protein n=1 Tax=Achromobacter deleyi TaxID=1353891 RepID=UPI0014926BA9|nr:hypothetical protein [Achromobacter deleyi]QVQ25960.1 hypothetical protein HLG70_24335 [Achromobacter deleyi]UIP21501.1 hypothetical protein LYZ39_03005 [Achromobacter deleyi]
METQDLGTNGPDGESMNIRASSYFVLQATHRCAACGEVSRVHALAVPPGHESTEADLVLDDDDDDSPGLNPQAFREWLFSPAQWQEIAGPAMISATRALSTTVTQAMQALAPRYRPNPDRGGEWSNFCEHCDQPIWDGALYPTPGQAFCPKDAEAAAQVTVHAVDAPFGAFYGMCWTDSYRNKWPLFARMGYALSEED